NRRLNAMAIPQNVKPASIGWRLSAYSQANGRLDFRSMLHVEDGDKPIPFPKLNVVLAMHLLGSTSRRLLVDAVELRGADHSAAAVHHEHSVPHDSSPILREAVIVAQCPWKAALK
ncbi:hypothetical protein, partial [Bradyrhizobium zhanjiangense]|uniref:hypothetical protein n=1 Tax=Bradyrhizobium zhanjiangense TaxID=1325107 RepID=UPI0019D6F239